ncbi:MAG: hypothetical protein AAFV26_01675, partial [Pseudomonadota bacterium]
LAVGDHFKEQVFEVRIANGRLAAEGTLEDLRARSRHGETNLEDLFLEVVADSQMRDAEAEADAEADATASHARAEAAA